MPPSKKTLKLMEAHDSMIKEDGLDKTEKDILAHTMTVGELMGILKNFDPNSPIQLGVTEEGNPLSMSTTWLTSFSSFNTDEDLEVLSLMGCVHKKEVWDEFKKDWIIGEE